MRKPRNSTTSQVGALKPEEEVRARHILVESKDKARELFEKIAHGGDFAAAGQGAFQGPGSKDQGGELGFFGRGQMVPQFEEAAFKLKKGEVSEPFKSQFGWHIIRVDDRRQRAARPSRRSRTGWSRPMIHKKAQQIATDLRGKAQIEYIDPEIKKLDGQRADRRAAEAVAAAPVRSAYWPARRRASWPRRRPSRHRSRRRACPSMPAVPGVRLAACEAGIRYQGRTDLMLAVLDAGHDGGRRADPLQDLLGAGVVVPRASRARQGARARRQLRQCQRLHRQEGQRGRRASRRRPPPRPSAAAPTRSISPRRA